MPKFVIERCMISKAFHSKKNDGRIYLTIEDGENTFNIGSGDLDLSKVPTITPISIEAEIGGFVFGKNQVLNFTKFSFKPAL